MKIYITIISSITLISSINTALCMQHIPQDVMIIIFTKLRAKQRNIEWAEQCLTCAGVCRQWKKDITPLVQTSFINISHHQKAEFLCYAIIEKSDIGIITFLAQDDIDIHLSVEAPYGTKGCYAWGYGKSSRSPHGESGLVIAPKTTYAWKEGIKRKDTAILTILLKRCKNSTISEEAVNDAEIALTKAVQRNDICHVEQLLESGVKANEWCMSAYYNYAQTPEMKNLLSKHMPSYSTVQ